MVSFIGREAASLGPKVAAASLCPSYDITKSFTYLQKKYPLVDWAITEKIKHFFLTPSANQDALRLKPEALAQAWKAKGLHEFLISSVPFADGTERLPIVY